jgi:sterol desaturase/sphingolipid hydroxylase (fatty acid hydroxylase superfamily)
VSSSRYLTSRSISSSTIRSRSDSSLSGCAMVFALHYSVLLVFTAFSLFMNVYGHLGFNLFSPEQLDRAPLRWFSHTIHHSWHHRHQRGNYGFYLLFWDRMMRTYKPSS